MPEHTDLTSIDSIRKSMVSSYNIYQESYDKAFEAFNFFHGRQRTLEQIDYLRKQGVPPLTFNLIRYFTHRILGFMSSTVNTVKITPQQIEDIPIAAINNDLVNYIYRKNGWDTDKGQDAVTQYLLSGLFCVSCMPVKTKKTDQFGRPIYDIQIENVNALDLVLDPASKEPDYSDARYIHRRILMTKEELMSQFPDADISQLRPGGDSVGANYGTFTRFQDGYGYGENNLYDVVHSVIVDSKTTDDERELDVNGQTNNPHKERVWSIYWCGGAGNGVELERKEITYRDVRFPYIVYKLHREDITNEFYGIFRDLIPMQIAINDELVAQHRKINDAKFFVKKDVFDDNNKAAEQIYNPDNPLIPVKGEPDGIIPVFGSKGQESGLQMQTLHNHIDLFREQLGINLAFVGNAPASDSGRKVQLQREASIAALSKTQRRIQQPYRLMARMICKYVSQYYRATQVFSIVERDIAQRWVEINSPALVAVRQPVIMQAPNGEVYLDHQNGPPVLDENGEPVFRLHFKREVDPETNDFMLDEDGEYVWAPVATLGSEIRFFDPDIVVDSTAYDNEQEIAMEFAHNLLNSAAGTLMAQVDPATYLTVFAELARGAKIGAGNKVAEALEKTAQKIEASQGQPGGNEVKQAGVNNVPGAGGN